MSAQLCGCCPYKECGHLLYFVSSSIWKGKKKRKSRGKEQEKEREREKGRQQEKAKRMSYLNVGVSPGNVPVYHGSSLNVVDQK